VVSAGAASDGAGGLAATSAQRYDGFCGGDLASRFGLPRVDVFDTIGSTLDAAHDLASRGAAAGTLVLADGQTAGRGRAGRHWRSDRGAGIWLTLIEQPRDVEALGVLSLRIGLALAPVLEVFAAEPVGLKWPNDLYAGDRKLAGVLVEVRWRDGAPEWAAIGVGINVRLPDGEAGATALRPGVNRIAVLDSVLPALRGAASLGGLLDERELEAYSVRDVAAGRACIAPVAGIVRGIDRAGALLVEPPTSPARVAVRSGSLAFLEVQ
jgi:BirA family transcriptional regulator, biotin operon repressor / biotin---[acetyl-CoA-carboxylase] ligase